MISYYPLPAMSLENRKDRKGGIEASHRGLCAGLTFDMTPHKGLSDFDQASKPNGQEVWVIVKHEQNETAKNRNVAL